MWNQQEKSVEEKVFESRSVQYVLCSPGLSEIFNKFDTNDDMNSFDIESIKTTPASLKSILKKTPIKSHRIICSPSSAAIRRTKSEVCRRSLSVRRELRFGPDTKKSPSITSIGLSPKKLSTSFRLKKLFRRNSVSTTTKRKVDAFVTSTPINFLDDADDDIQVNKKNWRSSIRNSLPLFYGTEKYQCAHCKRTWENNSDLLSHSNEHHKSVRHWLRPQYRCGICSSKFYNNKYLVRHCHLQHTPTTKRGKMASRKCIEQAISIENNDFSKVLTETAKIFKKLGFFLEPTWKQILSNSFNEFVDVAEEQYLYGLVKMEITDSEADFPVVAKSISTNVAENCDTSPTRASKRNPRDDELDDDNLLIPFKITTPPPDQSISRNENVQIKVEVKNEITHVQSGAVADGNMDHASELMVTKTKSNGRKRKLPEDLIDPKMSSAGATPRKQNPPVVLIPSANLIDMAADQSSMPRSSRATKNVKSTKSNQNQGDQLSQSALDSSGNPLNGNDVKHQLASLCSTVSEHRTRSEMSPVSAKCQADVKYTVANEKNGDDITSQLFVKTSKQQKKVSTRANKTVNAITKSNQDDDDHTPTDGAASRSRKRKATTSVSSIPSKISVSLSVVDSSTPSISPMRRSLRHQPLRVMFTMINPEPYKPILKRLNISMVDSDDIYDALVTDRVYRSSKFMCALASGKPIVSTEWLRALQEKNSRVDPAMFLLKDKDGEKKYKFSLAKTIAKSAKQGIFHNYSILVTPNTTPSPEILKDVIVSSGGKSAHPRKDDHILCISDRKDESAWPQLKKKYSNCNIVTVEGFMQAIFQYSINLQEYGLK